MSWTKRQIVVGAFEELGLGLSEFDIGPQNLESALRRLDVMMADWNGHGIRIGYAAADPNSSSLDQDSGVPDWSIRAILVNLAIQIAPMFGKQLPREVRVTAKEAFDNTLSRSSNEDPIEMEMPSSLPMGAGNRIDGNNNRTFFPQPTDDVEVGPDGDLDFY